MACNRRFRSCWSRVAGALGVVDFLLRFPALRELVSVRYSLSNTSLVRELFELSTEDTDAADKLNLLAAFCEADDATETEVRR